MKTKGDAPEAMQSVLREIRRLSGVMPHRLRTDNDLVLKSSHFQSVCDQGGIVLEHSAPYCQWQNGRIERMWRTLVDMAKCMLRGADLGNEFWGFAMACAVYIRNRVFSSGCGGIPIQLFCGTVPDLLI